MDFMNLNQAAHGDREFGFIAARLRLEHKVVVGHWTDDRGPRADRRLDPGGLREARLGDRPDRPVRRQHARGRGHRGRQGRGHSAVSASASTPTGSATSSRVIDERHRRRGRRPRRRLPRRVRRRPGPAAGRTRAPARCATAPGSRSASAGFLDDGGFSAFTTTFEDLHGLTQLPGLAAQRLMRDGYGFGAEGDWKTASMVRAMKVMTRGPARRRLVHGGLHLPPQRRRRPESRRAHARGLRVDRRGSPEPRGPPALDRRQGRSRSGSSSTPTRAPPSRRRSPTWATRFRHGRHGRRRRRARAAASRRLPVARALWRPRPDLETNAAAWIYAGGSHHTSLGYAVTPEHLRGLRRDVRVEFVLIDATTQLDRFRDQLRWNDLYYHLAHGL